MQEFLAETWQKVAPELRERVGEAAFDGWLAELRPLAMERGVLHMEGKNRLTCERVDRLYRSLIAEHLSKALGAPIEVMVVQAPESVLPSELEVGPTQPIVDESNNTAFLLLKNLIEGRDLPSSLFLFHGSTGTGKSFLLQWWKGLRAGSVIQMTGPQFSRAVQAAIHERRLPGLHEELGVDRPLILDEVHRVSGQKRVQAELAKLLERRSQHREPTLLASRWHPRDIWRLEAGLGSWLCAGFVTRLDLPGPAARLRFLRALEGPASRNGRGPTIEGLAREVQGAYPDLRRAWALDRGRRRGGGGGSYGHGRRWTLIEPRARFDQLLERVSKATGVPAEDLTGQSQRRAVSRARKILSWLCVREGLNRAEVGRFLGGRTRAAVSYSIKRFEEEMEADSALRLQVEGLL